MALSSGFVRVFWLGRHLFVVGWRYSWEKHRYTWVWVHHHLGSTRKKA